MSTFVIIHGNYRVVAEDENGRSKEKERKNYSMTLSRLVEKEQRI